MYQMDEPPDTFSKLFWLIIALIVLLVVGYAILAQETPQRPLLRSYDASPTILSSSFLPVQFDPIMAKLIECESGWNEEAIGDHGKAYGLLQFWESTFELYKNKYGLPELEYKDSDDQITLAGIMINDGEEHNWTCWKYVIL